MVRKLRRFKPLTLLFLCTACLGVIFLIRKRSPSERELLLKEVNNFINSGDQKLAFEGQACRIPILDVNATEIISLLGENHKVVCNKLLMDWVELQGSTLKIRSWVKSKYEDIKCLFTDIIRQDDFYQCKGLTTTSHTEYNLEASDVVSVHCTAKGGITWEKVFMGIRSDQEILDRSSWKKVPKDSLKMNLLMYGFDSMSHNMWKRKLPKTYKYATQDLKGIALNGYNIIGDGTPHALIPILTGKTELELPETRRSKGKKAQYVNVYPFFWNDLQNNGYVTAWGEDMADVGTFTYRLKGFLEQPVDHYMRTYFREAQPQYRNQEKYCYGELSRYQIMLDFVRNMFEVYKEKPKFVFAFHSEYSHEGVDWISNADDDTLEWLQEFVKKGYLENTLLILMSDHGSRFANLRNTQQGKQEERLPGFIFVFPRRFSEEYPEAYENFKKNADRLTTPFDIHETLKNFLHFEGAGQGDVKYRGISLFKEIPLSRTCKNAGIAPHWCTCLRWEPVAVDRHLIFAAVNKLLSTINGYTAKHRNLCAELKLKEILWAAKLLPTEGILRFKRSSDRDGFENDMSDQMVVTTEIFQVKVSFEPGYMLFEASIRFLTDEKEFKVSDRDISRIDRYRPMTECLEGKGILLELRKFCNCLKEENTTKSKIQNGDTN